MDPISASARYNAKLVPADISAILTVLLPTMQPAYGVSATAAANTEALVKGVLSGITVPAPIPTPDYAIYYAFARQIVKKARRFPGGPGLTTEIGYLVTTYTARGCSAPALASIVVALGY